MGINPQAKALMQSINRDKTFGPGTIVPASDMKVYDRFTTGSLSLDIALGGGLPANHWHEIIGMESHGKTAITLKTIAENQRRNEEFTALWVAAEHYDEDQATALGVDNDRVLLAPTQNMEQAMTIMLKYTESQSVDFIVCDSYPALIAGEEEAKDIDEAVMALGARLMGKFFRKAGSATKRAMDGTDRPFAGIMINQWRDAPGVWSPRGPAKTTPGGKAKNYAFYTRLEVKRDDWIKEKRPRQGEVKVGQTIKVTTLKNKSAPAQQVASIDFYFRKAPIKGFNRGDYDLVKEAIIYGVQYGIINKVNTRTHEYEGHRWTKAEDMVEGLREMPELVEKIRTGVLDVVNTGRVDDIVGSSDEDE